MFIQIYVDGQYDINFSSKDQFDKIGIECRARSYWSA